MCLFSGHCRRSQRNQTNARETELVPHNPDRGPREEGPGERVLDEREEGRGQALQRPPAHRRRQKGSQQWNGLHRGLVVQQVPPRNSSVSEIRRDHSKIKVFRNLQGFENRTSRALCM